MDKIKVSQRARDFTGEYLFGLGNITLQSVDHIKSGDWDDTYHVKEIARFERDIISHTPQSVEPVAWMYSKNGKVRTEHSPAPCQDMIDAGWKADPLYPDPPATNVAALVELREMLESADKEEGATIFNYTPEEIGLHIMENHEAILAALAPFTEGQDDE